jgi:hypothetical protein
MTEADDWRAERERYERFSQTELGKLYRAYRRATIDYWKNDANDAISNKRLNELDRIAREATDAFVAELMEIAGV